MSTGSRFFSAGDELLARLDLSPFLLRAELALLLLLPVFFLPALTKRRMIKFMAKIQTKMVLTIYILIR